MLVVTLGAAFPVSSLPYKNLNYFCSLSINESWNCYIFVRNHRLLNQTSMSNMLKKYDDFWQILANLGVFHIFGRIFKFCQLLAHAGLSHLFNNQQIPKGQTDHQSCKYGRRVETRRAATKVHGCSKQRSTSQRTATRRLISWRYVAQRAVKLDHTT